MLRLPFQLRAGCWLMEMPDQEVSHNRGAVMGANLSLSAGVFEPDDLEAMSLAYQEICDALHIKGDARARQTIAVRVIELARRGEPRPTVLRDQVLAEANAGNSFFDEDTDIFNGTGLFTSTIRKD